MTSLQKEEFFEFVATAQARRLDDQRAQLERSPPPKPKAKSFRGSIKQLSFVKKPEKPARVPAPKEDLYNMILTTQVSHLPLHVSVNALLTHKAVMWWFATTVTILCFLQLHSHGRKHVVKPLYHVLHYAHHFRLSFSLLIKTTGPRQT